MQRISSQEEDIVYLHDCYYFFSDKDYSLEVLKKLTEDWRISYLIYLKY